MDARELRFFEAGARLSAINRAAVELHTVQSNITARIRDLESELGCRLFDRRPTGVSLTASGVRLLPYAHRVSQVLAEAVQAARDNGTPSGTLTIGALETTAALRFSGVLASYPAAYCQTALNIDPLSASN